MNDGTFRGGANAFKLDTLLKLSDVKGADGKTTLLHFVVQEIIRSEGIRDARLAMESGTSHLIVLQMTMPTDFLKKMAITTPTVALRLFQDSVQRWIMSRG